MAGDQVYGVTPPISLSLPTDAENRARGALIEELHRQKTFESPSETQKREKILESLQVICNEFVRKVAMKREPNNQVLIRNARGKIFTYGSYLLGVFGPGSDIDTLVVAPKYVTRDDYFEYFPDLLVSMTPKGSVTDLSVVTDAFVPIIKFQYSDISIDLIYSRIIQKQLPPDFTLFDSNLLRGLDEPELRSLNGNRVTGEILALVPEQSTFKLALRAIKLWAQRRAIYANIMGFPGGVAWAMLVARVCQLYPKATTSVLVSRFFLIIGQWRWPQPVLLKPIETGPLPVRVWNPKLYKGDSFHLMPIITPAYPSMCATFNITKSSMAIIQRELKRGLDLSEQVMLGRRQWKDLFVKHTFFVADYKYYIAVISVGRTKEAHKAWSGYVESKIRVLVGKLDYHPSIALAHPFTKGYERRHLCKDDNELSQVQEGSLDFVTTEESIEPEEAPKSEEAAEGQDPVKAEPTEAVDVNMEQFAVVKTETDGEVKPEQDGQVKPEQVDQVKSEQVDQVKPEQDGQAKTEQDGEAKTKEKPRPPPLPAIVYTTTHYIGIQVEPKSKSLDLSYQVDEFKDTCMGWQKYKEDIEYLASIGVQHVKNTNLPDDVFEEGEKKPQKPAPRANGAASNGKKRGPSEDQAPPAKRPYPSAATAG